MPEPALTPALALDYLDELSTDIRGGVLLGADGAVAAAWRGDAERGERIREPLAELLERADVDADPADFRRYGSARKLYNFDVDNAGAY